MGLFGKRRTSEGGPPSRSLAGDAAAVRATLSARQAGRPGAGGGIDLRAIVGDLLEGEVEAPTADVSALVSHGLDADDFYERELAPSWEGLGEAQRAARLEAFLELNRMLDSEGGDGLPADTAATVRTKTLVLAWAFDETYGYMARLVRGESSANTSD